MLIATSAGSFSRWSTGPVLAGIIGTVVLVVLLLLNNRGEQRRSPARRRLEKRGGTDLHSGPPEPPEEFDGPAAWVSAAQVRQRPSRHVDRDATGRHSTDASHDRALKTTPSAEVRLGDVGGLENVKSRLQNAFLAPARNPELSAYYGKSLNGGLLLYGPPGCGKTYTARALAGELGANFHAIGLNDILDAWLGESERKLHEAFAAARRDRPSLLFLDEVDALGRKRGMIQGAGRTIVNQLLTELDGVEADNEGIYTLAATNHPWDVDTALRRPGRFDRMVFVAPPDASARAQIMRLHLRDRPTAVLDLSAVAVPLQGFSGADLAYLCESAVELAMQEALSTGERRPITQAHLERAAADIKPSTRAWFDIAQNVAHFAGEGGEYDELLAYLRVHDLA
jgi:SpoVK/Ycf46/Vps4 family AAA+-type ATPase